MTSTKGDYWGSPAGAFGLTTAQDRMASNESSEMEKALKKVVSELRNGLRHGFFEYRLTGEIVQGRKRQLVLEAGRKYKFIIAEDDLNLPSLDGGADS